MQTKAGSSCLAWTPQPSAHIPLTFSPIFKFEVRKTTSTYFQKNKKENLKYKFKRIPHTILEEITKQGLL